MTSRKFPDATWRRAEAVYHMDMAELLPKLIRAIGIRETAKRMGVSTHILNKWGKQLGFYKITLLVAADEEIHIVKVRDGDPVKFVEPERDLEEESLDGLTRGN